MVVGSRTDPRRSPGDTLPFPTVYVYTPSDDPSDCSLTPDDVDAGGMVAHHLAVTGRRSVLHVTGPHGDAAARDRATGIDDFVGSNASGEMRIAYRTGFGEWNRALGPLGNTHGDELGCRVRRCHLGFRPDRARSTRCAEGGWPQHPARRRAHLIRQLGAHRGRHEPTDLERRHESRVARPARCPSSCRSDNRHPAALRRSADTISSRRSRVDDAESVLDDLITAGPRPFVPDCPIELQVQLYIAL